MIISKRSTGFTLVELLVVISIISLLSSVVLISLQSARLKGQFAAGQIFDGNAYHSFGADAHTYWDMEAISAGKVLDSSNNNYNLTVVGTPSIVSGAQNKGIKFNSVSDYLVTSFAPTTAIYNSGTNGGTITMWLNSSDANQWSIIMTAYGNGDRTYISYIGGTVTVTKGNGSPCSPATCSILTLRSGVPVNQWVHVAISWTGGTNGGTGTVRGYFNGQKISQGSYTLDSTDIINGISIGQQNSTNWFNGIVDEVHYYSNQLSDADIQSKYAIEANRKIVALERFQ